MTKPYQQVKPPAPPINYKTTPLNNVSTSYHF